MRPPAPQIASDVPVSRSLWTVLLPREYGVSLVERESNLEEVAAAYHQEERKLSFLDELRQMEDLTDLLSAIVWAGLCLGLVIAAIQLLKRPNAAELAARYWPWLAAVAGTAWLFLLPVGVFGLALLVTALCVLIARSQKREARNAGSSNGTVSY